VQLAQVVGGLIAPTPIPRRPRTWTRRGIKRVRWDCRDIRRDGPRRQGPPPVELVCEAIFLSTFVMIGQNRQSAFQQATTDPDFNEHELELKTNTKLTRALHTLTTEMDCLGGPEHRNDTHRSCFMRPS
jgi:hypothetical protein